jgi:hypothetical protein
MAESSVSIKLLTTADTSGAVQTADAVKKVEQATKAANSADAQRSANAAAAATSLNTLHGAQEKAAGSSRNMGNALLQGSRALQDMQYGLAGAVNNLEGIASALGLGAGVAGIVTVLAVTVQTLGPQIAKFFDGLSTDKIQTDGLKSFVDQLGLVGTGRDRAAIAGERFERQLAAEDAALKAQMAVIKENTALFNLRNAAALGQAEFETQQAIEDIRAQGLPREVEAAAIAEKKLQLLERQVELQQAASDQALITAQQTAATAAAAAASAEKEAQRLEEILARSARLNQLKVEEVELERAATEARSQARMVESETEIPESVKKQFAGAAAAAEMPLAENRARQAAAMRGGLADASTPGLALLARETATAKAQAAAEAANAIAPANRMAEATSQVEAQRQKQERQRIEREASPKPIVMDGRNYIDVAPKPRERVEPDEWELASRVQPVQRPRRNLVAEEAAGRGGFQGRNLAAEEKEINTAPLNKTSESNDKVNAAVLAFAQTVAAKNDELTRKLTDLETKVKNSRP